MRAVLTRVKSASVTVEGNVIGKIGQGFLILLGVTHEDTEVQAVKLADKLTGLRIFEDENGKMNQGLESVDGQVWWCLSLPCTAIAARAAAPIFWLPPVPRWPSPCTRNSCS